MFKSQRPNLKTMLRWALFTVVMLLVTGGVLTGVARAQGDELRLSLRRDWGLGLGSQIQGLFTLSITGAPDITSVRYELDGAEIGTVTQPPFKFQFNTDRYPPGSHTLRAVARTSDGRELKSNTITVQFVSAEAAGQVLQRVMIPLLAVSVIVTLLSAVGPLVLGRGPRRLEPGAPRNYGLAGGAICPKCRRPFALSLFSLNLVTRKLARCPYCGTWSLVSLASREALAAAEAAEREASRPAGLEISPEEKLRRQIDESRYE